MERKRYKPAPNFRMPGAPFNPTTGERAPLGNYPSKGTVLALFQVIGDDPNDPETQDTHDNYVVCRGYEADADPEFRYLHDPYTAEDTTPINVAKPYSIRGTFPYELGQVIVAARIKGKLGYNPGKAVTVGQPADLDEEISLLTDDDDVAIAWQEIGGTPAINTPAICVPNTTIPACDWTTGDGPPFPALVPPWVAFPATGIGIVYAIQASSSNWKYQEISDPTSPPTIINPLPFSFTSDDVLRVANHNGQWVVLGTATKEIGYSLLLDSRTINGVGTFANAYVDWSSFTEKTWDCGGLVTNGGTTLTLAAPLGIYQMRFRVEWNTMVSAVFASDGTAADMQVGLHKNFVSIGQHYTRHLGWTSGAGQTHVHTCSGAVDMYLQQGDTLSLNIYVPNASGGSATIDETMIKIWPLLGRSLG